MPVVTRSQLRRKRESCPSPPIKSINESRKRRRMYIEESDEESENDNENQTKLGVSHTETGSEIASKSTLFQRFKKALIEPEMNLTPTDYYIDLYMSNLCPAINNIQWNEIVKLLYSKEIYHQTLAPRTGICDLCHMTKRLSYVFYNEKFQYYFEAHCADQFHKARQVIEFIKKARLELEDMMLRKFISLNNISCNSNLDC